jgi:hypothetical protein
MIRVTVASWFDKAARITARRVVSISTSEPNEVGFNPAEDAKFKELVPGWDLVMRHKNDLASDEQYTKEYKAMIEPRIDAVIAQLQDGDVLCWLDIWPEPVEVTTWCKHGNFCHRRIVAELLKERGIEVEVR